MILEDIKPLIQIALKEDIGKGDITSNNTIPKDKVIESEIIAKENIDGALIGGASLDPDKFIYMVKAAVKK